MGSLFRSAFSFALLVSSWVSGAALWAQSSEDWETDALLLYNAGSPQINDFRARSSGNRRLLAYAQALGLLFREPPREENALSAKKQFATLREVNPSDAVGMASGYYLARIAHRHLDRPDLEAARAAYRSLFEAHPERFFGELAFLKYLLMELYESDGSRPLSDRLSLLESLGGSLTIPDMRRGFHRSMGQAYQAFDLSETKALDHLKAAYRIPGPAPEMQSALLLDIAELAERLGERELAIEVLTRFVEVARRDPRVPEVSQRLAALKQGS